MPDSPAQLEAGAYEVIRKRLDARAADLRAKLDALDAARKAEFGGIETQLVSTSRITTENHCVPRDMAALGGRRFLFGYNVHLGLRQTFGISDVFAVFDYDPADHAFHPARETPLDDPAFATDFSDLYKYYKNAAFQKFQRIGPHLYMGMRVGRTSAELKTFKWQLSADGTQLAYAGNRSDHEFTYPPSHEFEWKRTTREMVREGEHPHVSIEDQVFVEMIGGDLTVKVENNTATGRGIYSEPVENADQTIHDGEIHYAVLGNLVLLKVLPFAEKRWRYLVFNSRTREAHRVDALAESAVLLPDGHGIAFPGGCVLQTGELRRYETGQPPTRFERRVHAANGEDTLLAFHDPESGIYILHTYNLITRTLAPPMVCHGFSLFPTGELLLFQREDEPRKHHVVQIWQTPFVADEAAPQTPSGSFLSKIGNAEIVGAMAECHALLGLLAKDDSFSGLYVEIARLAGEISDSYFWLDRTETGDLKASLAEIKSAAEAALGEFEKVSRLRKEAATLAQTLEQDVARAVRAASGAPPGDILGFVKPLADLRALRGRAIALRDVRYADLEAAARLEKESAEAADRLSGNCVTFLLQPAALDPYREKLAAHNARIPSVARAAEAAELESELADAASELEMLTEIVAGLKIADPTETTRIVEAISGLFAGLNQTRSLLRNRRQDLARSEGSAEFRAQIALLAQTVANYLEVADSPAACDDSLAKLLVQIEELEGRFADSPDFTAELAEKRLETQSAFEARRESLSEARARRCQALGSSAERILGTVRSRLASFAKPEEVHAWLAADPMVAKLHDLANTLRELGDHVRADDIATRLKSLGQDSLKQIRDKADLFDGDLVRFGAHAFSVNRQPLELSLIPRDGALCFHLAGTRFYEPVRDPRLDALRHVWDRAAVSEDPSVYRAEFLAWTFAHSLDKPAADTFLAADDDARAAALRDFMAPRHREDYTKGVHDHDAARIAAAYLLTRAQLGPLRHPPSARALAGLYWKCLADGPDKRATAARMQARGRLRGLSGETRESPDPTLRDAILAWLAEAARIGVESADPDADADAAALCLADELGRSEGAEPAIPLARSSAAEDAVRALRRELASRTARASFDACITALADRPILAWITAREWLETLVPATAPGTTTEAAMLVATGADVSLVHAETPASAQTLTGLIGAHPRIANGTMEFDFHDFTARLRVFETRAVPEFEAFQSAKADLVSARRADLRPEQFKAGVLGSFVRNRLIDRVYLPLIGQNLAKQIGAAGGDARTDRMGLLLLISPPGYGKTTLMEYVANRLGITLIKINGPALGHRVTSLDPAEAPNAGAREEVEKLNLAFEMGDNVMIYVDDIQHCHAEFLQKFIPLCDGTRRIEGVFRGEARTYDLRGRKVAVVMAGNPYTEVGGKFQVPDMLANRADSYNLGDILGGHETAFKDSYIENALTSNRALARVAQKSHADALSALRIAETGQREGIEFEAPQSPEEIEECIAVMKHLLAVREIVLRVNQEYIRSAATEDAYRTEPPFKLQGSYRNMNKIAEKIVPLMTAAEVARIVEDHYRGEAQTLGANAEANLLKWREINGLLAPAEKERWDAIRSTFRRNLLAGGAGENDPVSRITGQLGAFNQNLEKIGDAVKNPALTEETVQRLQKIIEGIREVPVNVEIKVLPVTKDDDTPPRHPPSP